MEESTRKEIWKITTKTLRDAGPTEPPLQIEVLQGASRCYSISAAARAIFSEGLVDRVSKARSQAVGSKPHGTYD